MNDGYSATLTVNHAGSSAVLPPWVGLTLTQEIGQALSASLQIEDLGGQYRPEYEGDWQGWLDACPYEWNVSALPAVDEPLPSDFSSWPTLTTTLAVTGTMGETPVSFTLPTLLPRGDKLGLQPRDPVYHTSLPLVGVADVLLQDRTQASTQSTPETGYTLSQICTALLTPYGVSVTCSLSPDPVIPRFDLQHQRPLEALNELLYIVQGYWYENATGGITIATPTWETPIARAYSLDATYLRGVDVEEVQHEIVTEAVVQRQIDVGGVLARVDETGQTYAQYGPVALSAPTSAYSLQVRKRLEQGGSVSDFWFKDASDRICGVRDCRGAAPPIVSGDPATQFVYTWGVPLGGDPRDRGSYIFEVRGSSGGVYSDEDVTVYSERSNDALAAHLPYVRKEFPPSPYFVNKLTMQICAARILQRRAKRQRSWTLQLALLDPWLRPGQWVTLEDPDHSVTYYLEIQRVEHRLRSKPDERGTTITATQYYLPEVPT